MKIAKASVADLDMALELVSALDTLSSNWGPSMPEKIAKPQRDYETEGFSLDDDENCRRVCEYLIRLTRSASLSRVAAFNALTGRDLAEADGWLLLQLLKDARQWSGSGFHKDSAEDCVAYAALKAEALERERK